MKQDALYIIQTARPIHVLEQVFIAGLFDLLNDRFLAGIIHLHRIQERPVRLHSKDRCSTVPELAAHIRLLICIVMEVRAESGIRCSGRIAAAKTPGNSPCRLIKIFFVFKSLTWIIAGGAGFARRIGETLVKKGVSYQEAAVV